MKVQNNSIYMGDDIRSARHEENGKTNSKQRKSIDGSVLQAKFDPIAAKREEAKKKALKIVGDTFTNELKIDDDINSGRERIKTLQRNIGDAKNAIKELEDNRASLRDKYDVDVNSQEEQDLKLLEKEIRYKMPGSDVHFEDGDLERIEQLKKNGLTEYQQRSLEMLEYEIPYANTVYENKQEIMVENQIISAITVERLKNHTMTDAEKQAEAVMDAASEEIISMLVDEAKEHLDEESEKAKETAKEKAEEKEELETRIEKAKEEKKEKEKVTEEILDGVIKATNDARDMESTQKEIKDMVNKMKLIEEDIKGAAVDKSL